MNLTTLRYSRLILVILVVFSTDKVNVFANDSNGFSAQIDILRTGNDKEISNAIYKLGDTLDEKKIKKDDETTIQKREVIILELIKIIENKEFKYKTTHRYDSIVAIGKIAKLNTNAIKYLCNLIKQETNNSKIRSVSINSLQNIVNQGHEDTIATLLDVLNEEYPNERISPEILNNKNTSKGRIDEEANKLLARRFEHWTLHTQVAEVLSEKTNNTSDSRLTELIKIIKKEKYYEVVAPISQIFLNMAENSKKNKDLTNLNLLVEGREAMNLFVSKNGYSNKTNESIESLGFSKKVGNATYYDSEKKLRDNLSSLDDKILSLTYISWKPYLEIYYGHQYIFNVIVFIILLLQVWLILLWLRPLWILKINNAVSKVDLKVPIGSGITVSLNYVILTAFFRYNSRVLNKWVEKNCWEAKKRFDDKPTVLSRSNYISTEISVDGESTPSSLKLETLQQYYEKTGSYLLIWGDAGIGKTSLACFLSKKAMEKGIDGLCYQHQMLPILIEQDIEILPGTENPNNLLREIGSQVKNLIGAEEKPSEEFLKQLLKKRRIIVIIDGFSELDKASRQEIINGTSEIPINSMIFTSRVEERIGNVSALPLQPLRIEPNKLLSFLSIYFGKHKSYRNLLNDQDIERAWKKLRNIVGDKKITALLATAYAEHFVTQKIGNEEEELPDNIPDLMLTYIKQIHRKDTYSLETVIFVAQKVAWFCVKDDFIPRAIYKAKIYEELSELGNVQDDYKSIVEYIEKDLKLIRTFGSTNDRLRFSIDPLTEYLASLDLISNLKDSEQKWNTFFNNFDTKSKETSLYLVKGFLSALYECCNAKGKYYNIPDFVMNSLKIRLKGVDSHTNNSD